MSYHKICRKFDWAAISEFEWLSYTKNLKPENSHLVQQDSSSARASAPVAWLSHPLPPDIWTPSGFCNLLVFYYFEPTDANGNKHETNCSVGITYKEDFRKQEFATLLF